MMRQTLALLSDFSPLYASLPRSILHKCLKFLFNFNWNAFLQLISILMPSIFPISNINFENMHAYFICVFKNYYNRRWKLFFSGKYYYDMYFRIIFYILDLRSVRVPAQFWKLVHTTFQNLYVCMYVPLLKTNVVSTYLQVLKTSAY